MLNTTLSKQAKTLSLDVGDCFDFPVKIVLTTGDFRTEHQVFKLARAN